MRGKTRRRKTHPNYGRIALALILLILIIALAIFGISKIIDNNRNIEVENTVEAEEQEVIVPEDITINLVATGDIMCHSTNFKAAYNSETKEYDFSYVFTNVAKYITEADIAIRKLRNNICRRG